MSMFDALRFLQDQFRDADGVLGLLNAYGIPNPPRDTVRKWFHRRSVPSEWLPLLICVAELEQGAPVRLATYIDLGRTA